MANEMLSDLALPIVGARYFINDKEDWTGLADRVGFEVGNVEPNNTEYYQNEFSSMIENLEFLPGGRILRNIRRPRGSLFNCYVEPMYDSIKEIGDFISNALVLWSSGGGVGVNASHLRPDLAEIKGQGGTSSGPVSFLRAANAAAETIKTGGSRRAAALALMHVRHPDIKKFIDAKMIHGELNNFNISVAVTEKFLEAVETDSNWETKWAQKEWTKFPARTLWNRIMDNMVKFAEPGLLNWDKLTSNNSYYFDPILATNPCGEVPLGAHGVCCLGSLVLPKFITGSVNTNWQKLAHVVRLAVRFLDDIIDINKYELKDTEQNAFGGRRIGLGIMGLAEYLFAKKIRYGSPKAIIEIERLMRYIRDVAYEESIKLAEEKGAFPKFDSIAFSKAHFIRELKPKMRMSIKKYGMRNVTVMAIAPTGTISLVAGVTSSAEPLPYRAFMRHDEIGDRMYLHPIYKELLDSGDEIPEWYVDTTDLKPEDHLDTQAIIQKYTDSAVSKTINMPKGTTADMLSDLMLEYIRDLKGVTLYVDGSRKDQIINPVAHEEVVKYINDMDITDNNIETVSCASGQCEI